MYTLVADLGLFECFLMYSGQRKGEALALRWEAYCKAAGLSDAVKTEHYNVNNKHTYTSTRYVPRITPHQLRHEFVTLCFDAELDGQDTQVIVGHASASTTREVYNHIKESRKILNTDKLNSYIQHNT